MRRSLVRFASLASAALALGATVFVASPATACQGACPAKRFAPAVNDGAVPASLAAFPVAAMADGDLSLRDASGAHVEGSLVILEGVSFFRPASPLAPGRFTATWEDRCNVGKSPVTFTVTESAPLPSATGELSVWSAKRTTYSLPNLGPANDCYDTFEVATVDVVANPDPSIAPYDDAVVWQWRIDGGGWGSAMPWSLQRSSTTLVAPCRAEDVKPGRGLLGLGTHDVEARALLADHATDPMKLRVRLSCGEMNGERVPSEGPLETEAPAPSSSAGTPEGAATKDAASPGGCAVTRGRAASSNGLVVVAAGAVAMLRRLVRRRRAR